MGQQQSYSLGNLQRFKMNALVGPAVCLAPRIQKPNLSPSYLPILTGFGPELPVSVKTLQRFKYTISAFFSSLPPLASLFCWREPQKKAAARVGNSLWAWGGEPV